MLTQAKEKIAGLENELKKQDEYNQQLESKMNARNAKIAQLAKGLGWF